MKLPCNVYSIRISSSSVPSQYSCNRWFRCLTTTADGSTACRHRGQVAASCCSHVSRQPLWNVCLHFNFLISSPSSQSDKHTLHSTGSTTNPVLYGRAGTFLSTILRNSSVVIDRRRVTLAAPRTNMASSRRMMEKNRRVRL